MEIQEIAKYLASEIMSSSYTDLKSLEIKIKSALTILVDKIPKKQYKEHYQSLLVSKKKDTEKHKNYAQLSETQTKFWKNKTRVNVDLEKLSEYCFELEILEQSLGLRKKVRDKKEIYESLKEYDIKKNKL